MREKVNIKKEEKKLKGNLTENMRNFYCMSKLLKHL